MSLDLTPLDKRLLQGQELTNLEESSLRAIRIRQLDYNEFSRERWYGNKGSSVYITIPEAFDGDPRLTDHKSRGYKVWLRTSTDKVRLLFLADYLLAEVPEHLDVKTDMRQVRRLEGELRRFGAREQGKLPNEVELNSDLVTQYCTNYRLGELAPIILEELRL